MPKEKGEKTRGESPYFRKKSPSSSSNLIGEAVLLLSPPDDNYLDIIQPFAEKVGNVLVIDGDAPDQFGPIPTTVETVIVVTAKNALTMVSKFHMFNRIYPGNILGLMDLLYALKPY